MAGLLLETDDFAYAAWALSGGAADPLTEALFRLQSALDGCGGMAGADPGGQSWAAGYDAVAKEALTGLRALANGCYRLAAMFSQTCRNYAAAESASTVNRWAVESVGVDVAQLPGTCSVGWAVGVPSAVGASAGGPPGWSLVSGLVGHVWPGGHQDRLRTAAAAWRAAAMAVDAAGAQVEQVPRQFAAGRLPESADMAAVCQATVDAAQRLATSMHQAAWHCEDLAASLDQVHREVSQELSGLLETSVLIEGIGQVVSVLTAGAAEAPTQAVEAGRLAAAAARIGGLIDAFGGAVAGLAARLPALADMAATVGRGLGELFDRELAVAAVEPVRSMAPEISTVNGITRTEIVGEQALAGEGAVQFGEVDLRAEEAAGGHTIAKHVAKTVEELKARDIPMASSFRDLQAAGVATERNLASNRPEILRWLAGGKPKITIYGPVNADEGMVYLKETGAVVSPTRVRTVLVRAHTASGFVVRTSFPDI